MLARRHAVMAPIHRAKVPKMRKPEASSSFAHGFSACQSAPDGFEPACPHVLVRRHVERALESPQEMIRTQRSNVGERGNAEASIAEVSVDVRDDALYPATIEF